MLPVNMKLGVEGAQIGGKIMDLRGKRTLG